MSPKDPASLPQSLAGPLSHTRWLVGERRATLLILITLVVLWFSFLELRGLFDPDEGRYAQIPQAMLATGDWITPRLNGLKYFEKPPLQYWATAAIYGAFGEDEWTARLWGALTGFLGALVVGGVGSRLSGPRVGRLAGLMLATSLGYFLAGQYVTLDMGLSFFLTCVLAGVLLANHEGAESRTRERWMLLAWAGMALAVMSKGLVGIVLPALALTAYVIVARDWALIYRLSIGKGLAVFFAITAPWFILVQIRNPEFLHFFFVQEHFQRFALPGHQRPGPWWYFIPIVLVGSMPWTSLVARAILRTLFQFRPRRTGGFDVDLFLVIWAVSIVVFFSASSSKLPAYVLPALPALALLTARRVEVSRALLREAAMICAGSALIVAGAAYWLVRHDALLIGLSSVGEALFWGCAALAVVLAVSVAAVRFGAAHSGGLGLAILALAMPFAVQLTNVALYTVDELRSSERLVESIFGGGRRSGDPASPFYSVEMFHHSLSFYAGRPTILVGHRSELSVGIATEPEKYRESIETFKEEWGVQRDAYAVMTPARYRELAIAGLPMRVLGRDAKRVIVARQ